MGKEANSYHTDAPIPLCEPTLTHEPLLGHRLRLLKAYKPSAAQSMTVGVVGFPHDGKSSLINTLKLANLKVRFPSLFPLAQGG